MGAAFRLSPPRRPRWGTLAVVALFHLLAIAGLVRVFTPDLARQAARQMGAVLVSVTMRKALPPAAPAKPDAGASAAEGRKAAALPMSAPSPLVRLEPAAVPPVASTGAQAQSGATAIGEGLGGAGEGAGAGSGASGSGQGGGLAAKAVLISGAIDAAKDFPIPPGGREARIGRAVIIALTVGIDGVPTDCSVYRSSGLSDTDERTCDLAMQRLRFRPATNARGEPVVSTFYWQQRFFR